MEVWYRLSSDNDYEWQWSPHLLASTVSYQIPGLRAGQPYLFSVRGINREGAGHFSDIVEAKGEPTVINRDPKKSGRIVGYTVDFKFQVSSLFKNSKIKQKRETGPQEARANLGGPDLQLFKDKINVITIVTVKDRNFTTGVMRLVPFQS